MIDHRADGRPHGDLVDAGARDVAADPDELDAGGAVCPLRLEPLHALDEDQWHRRERLDVVDDRRLLPQPVRPGKRRLVPRLRALVLDGLEQRRLLAADVPARADEHAHVEGQVRAEDAPTEQAVATAGGQLALEMFGLRLVLVAYIDDALVGADDEAGQDHALDHQMRHVIEDEAVLDGPRLALVGIAHDVLRRPGRPPHDLPLHPRREAGAAEAPEVAGLERPQQLAHVPARDVGQALAEPEALIVGEKEGAIFLNGATQASAELVLPVARLRTGARPRTGRRAEAPAPAPVRGASRERRRRST